MLLFWEIHRGGRARFGGSGPTNGAARGGEGGTAAQVARRQSGRRRVRRLVNSPRRRGERGENGLGVGTEEERRCESDRLAQVCVPEPFDRGGPAQISALELPPRQPKQPAAQPCPPTPLAQPRTQPRHSHTPLPRTSSALAPGIPRHVGASLLMQTHHPA